jgi:hypothetical protein
MTGNVHTAAGVAAPERLAERFSWYVAHHLGVVVEGWLQVVHDDGSEQITLPSCLAFHPRVAMAGVGRRASNAVSRECATSVR